MTNCFIIHLLEYGITF